jgi:hypothetical protein
MAFNSRHRAGGLRIVGDFATSLAVRRTVIYVRNVTYDIRNALAYDLFQIGWKSTGGCEHSLIFFVPGSRNRRQFRRENQNRIEMSRKQAIAGRGSVVSNDGRCLTTDVLIVYGNLRFERLQIELCILPDSRF